LFIPLVHHDPAWREKAPDVEGIARELGFVTINLNDVFRGHDAASIRLAEWDKHPNAAGHRVIASGLYDALMARYDTIFETTRRPRR
jgi:hypothetical protein